MIELAILIVVVVALFKFNSTVSLYSKGAQDTTSSWLEDKLLENAEERQERMKEVKALKERYNIERLAAAEDLLKELGFK